MTSLRKQCSKCGRVLLIENFSKKGGNSDGLRSSCKKCDAQYRREWQKNGGAEYMRIYAKANPVKVITSSLVRGAKARAKDKNLPFDIDLDYVRSMVGENAELASHCPVFGIPLDWSCIRNNGNKALPNSPSIDRIDPERGYIKGNIKIISFRANQIKSDGSPSELKLVAAYCAKALVDSLEF
jgi:hypothetical protein